VVHWHQALTYYAQSKASITSMSLPARLKFSKLVRDLIQPLLGRELCGQVNTLKRDLSSASVFMESTQVYSDL